MYYKVSQLCQITQATANFDLAIFIITFTFISRNEILQR